MRMLDLFCGRLGWSRAFLAKGWDCVGVDLLPPGDAIRGTPEAFSYLQLDVLTLGNGFIRDGHFDFICASPPCEQFSVHGMKHFHPNPPYPELGIKLFNHTRELCEFSGVPYVIENVRAAQQFVGRAVHHCGPFYLWETGVPLLLNQGIIKGMTRKAHGFREYKGEPGWNKRQGLTTRNDKKQAALAATIPAELANTVADYAERLLEVGDH